MYLIIRVESVNSADHSVAAGDEGRIGDFEPRDIQRVTAHPRAAIVPGKRDGQRGALVLDRVMDEPQGLIRHHRRKGIVGNRRAALLDRPAQVHDRLPQRIFAGGIAEVLAL